MSGEIHRRVIEQLRAIPGAEAMEMPPPVFRDLGGEVTAFDREAGTTRARWPLPDRHRGPTGVVQGGVLTVLFDNTFGALAYLSGEGFFVSLDLQTTFVRPLGTDHRRVEVAAELVDRTRRFLILRGEALREDGSRAALCETTMVEVEPNRDP